jgi:hypothetical protein
MSEENKEQVQDSVPQELIQIQETVRNLHTYLRLLDDGTFPGKKCNDVVEFRKFMKDLYEQAFKQMTSHPYYIAKVGNVNSDG